MMTIVSLCYDDGRVNYVINMSDHTADQTTYCIGKSAPGAVLVLATDTHGS